jgi:plastocyanin
MNKIIICFCCVVFLASCAKKEEPAEVSSFANYKVVSVQNGGTISGQISRTDSVPYLERVTIQRDQPVCGESHLNPSHPGTGGVRGCVVWLEGITEGKAFDFSTAPKLEQRGCAFLPHIQIVQAGATMLVTNDDDALHNYHVRVGSETVTNEAQPEGAPPHELTLKKSGLHQINCDVHPWMKGFVMAADHPYYTVSDSTGRFTLNNVPPGTYSIKLWRDDWRVEELKNESGRIVSYKWKPDRSKEAQVTVTAGQAAQVDFSLP